MLKMTVENITPEIAAEYLKKNVRNYRKKMNRNVIRKYASDMKAGLWELNGEAIEFDDEGFLKNGQHRLAAIIMSGTTVKIAVIRGVSPNVNIYDDPFVRTVTQMVNAEETRFDCNQTIASAANIVLNVFRPSSGKGNLKKYICDHMDDFERAYRITCYGSGQKIKSKCGPCVAATYLALRMEIIPAYELEVFFRAFNTYGDMPSNGYIYSPCLTARRMFEEKGRSSSGYQIQKEKLEITVMAIQDFHNGLDRTENYKLAEPFHFQEWIDDVKRKDGNDK